MGLNALFLGYGRMGAALGEAWLAAGLVDGIDAVDPLRAQDVKARIYRQAADLPATRYDLVVIAVKPAMAREALSALPASQLEKATVMSVMAGVSIDTLRAALPVQRPVVRSMPNTPVMVRQGCVGLYAGNDVSSTLRDTLTRLLNAVGRAFWVQNEDQLHAVTAISGSGPAYYHLFSEALADAAVQLGLPGIWPVSWPRRPRWEPPPCRCRKALTLPSCARPSPPPMAPPTRPSRRSKPAMPCGGWSTRRQSRRASGRWSWPKAESAACPSGSPRTGSPFICHPAPHKTSATAWSDARLHGDDSTMAPSNRATRLAITAAVADDGTPGVKTLDVHTAATGTGAP